MTQWEKDGSGPYSTLDFSQFITYTTSATPDGKRDLVVYGGRGSVLGHLPPYTNLTNVPGSFTLTVSESHPRNRAGTVTLRTADPRDVPEINFEFFAVGGGGDEDLVGLVDGLQFARRVFDVVPAPLTPAEVYPGRDEVGSREQICEWVRKEAFGHHPAGTCAIDADAGPLAVLDFRLIRLASRVQDKPSHPSPADLSPCPPRTAETPPPSFTFIMGGDSMHEYLVKYGYVISGSMLFPDAQVVPKLIT